MGTGLAPAVEYHLVDSMDPPDLRPLQRYGGGQIRGGADALLDPTAAGKTEAEVVDAGVARSAWSGSSARSASVTINPSTSEPSVVMRCRVLLRHCVRQPAASRRGNAA